MKTAKLIISLMAVILMVATGCERKVTNVVNNYDTSLLESAACMKCHGDQDLALVAAQKQWATSIHASGRATNRDRNASASDSTCERCHTAEGFLAYVTKTPFDGSHFSTIGCFTCHAPHTTGTLLAFRVTDPVMLRNGFVFDHGKANLCATCHQSRQNVNTYVADSVKLSTRFGPHHGPQGEMLAGTGGYQYAGYTYTNSPHTNVTEDGCIECHMAPSTGIELGGHSWRMAIEAEGSEEQELAGCNVATCHAPALADFNYKGWQDSVVYYWAQLGAALKTAGLAQFVIDSTVTPYDTTYAPKANKIVKSKDSSGAVFNYMMIFEDKSEGVHNTKYALGLLKSSLNYIRTGHPNGVAGSRPEQVVAER